MFCDNARSIGLDNIIQTSIEDIEYNNEFDAILACASLLHLKTNQLVDVFKKCYKVLKDDGTTHVSFKYCDFEGIVDDRYFTYLTEETFTNNVNQTNFKIYKLWINEDKLIEMINGWNDLLVKLRFSNYLSSKPKKQKGNEHNLKKCSLFFLCKI